MDKLVFLIFIARLQFISCSNNIPDDNLVSFNVGDTPLEGTSSTGESQRQVANLLKAFMPPSFWTPSTFQKNSQCKADLDGVFQEAAKLNFWALKILDASAKLPSGILSGNLNQFGDFDECIASQGHFKSHLIRGKYCLANVEIKVDKNQTGKIRVLDAAIHSNRMLTNELKDEGHRIPRFETFNIGICMPESCGREELETAFNEHMHRIFRDGFLSVNVSVSDDVCYVKEEEKFSPVRLAVVSIFLVTLVLTILGTAMDVKKVLITESKLQKLIQCFSLKKSWSILLKTDSSKEDIRCLHGVRFLNAVALLLSHKQIAMLFNPVINRTAMTESFGKTWTMIGRSAILYTDSFILFSGLLASYSLVKDLDGKKGIKFKEKLINRIVRFAPNLIFLILFCTYIMDGLGSGPQWGLVVTKYTDLCKKHMWRNFLFIHNYFGFENMCMTHTHQLGIDMQLFLMSPVFIFTIWKFPKSGFLLISIVAVFSTWLRYDVTLRENLSTILYYGISVDRLWRTANLSYILPTHRLTVYLIGICLGYYLRRGGRTLKMSNFQATIGWILALLAGLLAVFGPHRAARKDYVYDAKEAAQFNAFAPVLWTLFISWGVLACVNGQGGILNRFLSWKYFAVFTRISYAVYLTQFPVFFYNVGVERTAQYYKGFHSLFDVMELGSILIASLMLTLIYDIPFQEVKKILTSASAAARTAQNKDKKEEESENIRHESRAQKGRKRLQSFGT